jgi:cytochrome c-type biogenesis protein CcmE
MRLGVVLALLAGAVAFLLVKGLGDATAYYRNADEAVAQRDDLGTKRFRVQGLVVPGSVEQVGTAVEFDIEFHCAVLHVAHEGDPPELFKPTIPVVLEGRYDDPPSEVFLSDRIIINHTNEYRVDEDDLDEAVSELEDC